MPLSIIAVLSTSAVLLFTYKLVGRLFGFLPFGRRNKLTSLESLIQNPKYNVQNIKAPKLSGFLLKLTVEFLECDIWPLNYLPSYMLHKSGFSRLRELDITTPMALVPIPRKYQNSETQLDQKAIQQERERFFKLVSTYWEKNAHKENKNDSSLDVYTSVQQYHSAYLQGRITPLDVARNIIKIYTEKQDKCNGIVEQIADLILEQAEQSTKRYQKKQFLSVLDGVPFLVKDCIDVAGYYSRFGCKIKSFAKQRISTDAPTVARLRQAGAVMVGKTNMAEIGMDARSLNPHFGYIKNPHNLSHESGGSSSGSAALVGANLTPLSLGTDGGSSIRNPASLCGVYGLKPTHGRVPQHQQSKPGTFSVTVTGPLASDAISLSLAYAAIAGQDPPDHQSTCQPNELGLDSLKLNDPSFYSLRNLKIAFYREYFEDVPDRSLSKQVENFLDTEICGHYHAKRFDVKLPLLEELRVAHLLTIATESRSGYSKEMQQEMDQFSHSTRLTILTISEKLGLDYVNAQRLRYAALRAYDKIFKDYDVIVLPSTAITAPKLPSSASYGESDLSTTGHLMKFAFLANFLGLPAVSIPIGFDSKGLPIGIQFMSKWWCEDILLKLSILCERRIQQTKPQVHYQVLQSPLAEKIAHEQRVTEEMDAKKRQKKKPQPLVEVKPQPETKPAVAPPAAKEEYSPETPATPTAETSDQERRSKRRLYAMAEFLSTERGYVRNLALFQERFVAPLKKVLTPKEHKQLFGQLEVVLQTNTLFLSDLERVLVNDNPQDQQEEELADLMLRNSQMFKLYTPYISAYTANNQLANSLMAKNKNFETICREASRTLKKERHTLYSFFGLMITPIQRLPRMKLLLAEILKNTPKDASHYQKLSKATEEISSIASYCNDKTRENENMGRLLELEKSLKLNLVQPSRRLLAEMKGSRVRENGKTVKCSAYCFNDLLIVKDVKTFQSVLGMSTTKQISLDADCNTNLLPMEDPKTIVLSYESVAKKKTSRRASLSPNKEQKVSDLASQDEDTALVFKNLHLQFATEREAKEWNDRIKEILSS